MKKPVFLLIVFLVSGMGCAFAGNPKTNPTVDNTSIRKSEKAEGRQIKEFQNHSRYSSIVYSHRGKALRKQQAKQTDNGKGQ